MPVSAAAPVADKQAPSSTIATRSRHPGHGGSDGRVTFPLEDNFITNAKKEEVNAVLEKRFCRGCLHDLLCALVINTGGKLVVVDTGLARFKRQQQGANGQFAANLAAAGFDAKAVDMVVISTSTPTTVNGLLAADGTPGVSQRRSAVPPPNGNSDGRREMSRAPEAGCRACSRTTATSSGRRPQRRSHAGMSGARKSRRLLAVESVG